MQPAANQFLPSRPQILPGCRAQHPVKFHAPKGLGQSTVAARMRKFQACLAAEYYLQLQVQVGGVTCHRCTRKRNFSGAHRLALMGAGQDQYSLLSAPPLPAAAKPSLSALLHCMRSLIPAHAHKNEYSQSSKQTIPDLAKPVMLKD